MDLWTFEGEDTIFLRKAGKQLPSDTAPHPRIKEFLDGVF
jgi:hypothetical protein